jgi:chlorophyllide a reductase subunit Z
MDKVDATPARLPQLSPWDDDARDLVDAKVAKEPFIVRISAAKRLREQVEHAARAAGEGRVTAERVRSVFGLQRETIPA